MKLHLRNKNGEELDLKVVYYESDFSIYYCLLYPEEEYDESHFKNCYIEFLFKNKIYSILVEDGKIVTDKHECYDKDLNDVNLNLDNFYISSL